MEPISVKGKTGKINIFHPYPKEFHGTDAGKVVRAPGTGALGNDPPPNAFGAMHRQQLRNVAVYKAATTVQSLVNPGGGGAGGKNRRYSTEPNRVRNTLRGPLSQVRVLVQGPESSHTCQIFMDFFSSHFNELI